MSTHLRRILLLLGFLAAGLLPAQEVAISEFLAVNDGTNSDVDGDSSDWVELYNPAAEAISLAGWYRTDDSEDLLKWPFPPVELGRGSYLVVFASGKDRRRAEAELHTNFSLDRDGEYLALVDPADAVATEFAPVFPRQRGGFSFGRGESLVGDRLSSEHPGSSNRGQPGPG